jgi:hypothetical protein
MSSVLIILCGLAVLSVLGVLGLGLFSMVRGGEFNKKYGNKLMQARVILQALALIMLFLAYYFAS